MEELIAFIKAGDMGSLKSHLTRDPDMAKGKTEQGISLLQFAAYCRNAEAIAILKTHITGLDLFEAACLGEADTLMALAGNSLEIINTYSADGFTPLGLAAFFGHTDLVRLLIANGADPNLASNNTLRVAPLHSACAISNLEIAKLLLEAGGNVNAKQMQGVTPLHSAAHNGKTGLAKMLLDNGADTGAKMENGQTPYEMALEKGFTETADLIKEYGGGL
jgi:ankyrin repeat protein